MNPDLHIGISLDGDSEGNAWRVGYDGVPSYQRCRHSGSVSQAGRKVGVIAAVTPRVLDRADAVLDHVIGFEAINAISFVPCFDAAVNKITASPSHRLPASRVLQRANVSATGGPAWAITPTSTPNSCCPPRFIGSPPERMPGSS